MVTSDNSAISISLMLNTNSRIRHIARPLNLIPWAVPVVVTGIAFRFAFDGDFGQFSDLDLVDAQYELPYPAYRSTAQSDSLGSAGCCDWNCIPVCVRW